MSTTFDPDLRPFIKNDRHTRRIVHIVSKIVPKACDILGISYTESDSEDDDSEVRVERTLDIPAPPVTNVAKASSSHGQSVPPNVGVSRKRRQSSISSAETGTEELFRKRAMLDLDFLRSQLNNLAAVERVQRTLLERYSEVSATLVQKGENRDEDGTNSTTAAVENSATNSITHASNEAFQEEIFTDAEILVAAEEIVE